MEPQLAMVNIFPDPAEVRTFALEHGFHGVEWSFKLQDLPETPARQSEWVRCIEGLRPLDVRYHCPFFKVDLGHDDPARAEEAGDIFRRIVRLISKAGGGVLSIHIGLGRNSMEPLSWGATLDNLRGLVQYGADRRVRVCVENLAWGWTSRPNLFEKIIRMSRAGVTFDLGHAFSCRAVKSGEFSVEDFLTPHPERLTGAHIYHEEIEGTGHLPPQSLEDISSRLDLLCRLGCPWWNLELHNPDELIQTLDIVRGYLAGRSCRREMTSPDAF